MEGDGGKGREKEDKGGMEGEGGKGRDGRSMRGKVGGLRGRNLEGETVIADWLNIDNTSKCLLYLQSYQVSRIEDDNS